MQGFARAVDSFSILFSHPFFSRTSHTPGVFGGFPERSGSLERIEMEATPRLTDSRGRLGEASLSMPQGGLACFISSSSRVLNHLYPSLGGLDGWFGI